MLQTLLNGMNKGILSSVDGRLQTKSNAMQINHRILNIRKISELLGENIAVISKEY